MKHIIIDTNVVHLDYMLNKSRIMALCSTCDSLDHVVFMPDVVIDELVKQYREEIQGYTEQYNSAIACNGQAKEVLAASFHNYCCFYIAATNLSLPYFIEEVGIKMILKSLTTKCHASQFNIEWSHFFP